MSVPVPLVPLSHRKTRVLLTMPAHGRLGQGMVQGLCLMATYQALDHMHCEHATPVFCLLL